MKALSVKQPWAWLIANGYKTIETRTWPTRYRGPLLIVASKGKMDKVTQKAFYEKFPLSDIEYGKAICTVNLVDCHLMTKADEKAAACSVYDRAHSWVLNNIRKIKPFPVKGQLGLYDAQIPIETIDRYDLNW